MQFFIVSFFLIAMLLACNPKSNGTATDTAATDNTPIEKITVKLGFHEKIDLDKETYTVYFRNLTAKEYKFTLSDTDKAEIAKMARQCGLAQLKDSTHVEDKCQMFPKVMTEFSYYAGGHKVKVIVDEFCDEHPLFKRQQAEKIQNFLTFIHKMVRIKPEVATAAQTDITYH
jgi:hypothetical protein